MKQVSGPFYAFYEVWIRNCPCIVKCTNRIFASLPEFLFVIMMEQNHLTRNHSLLGDIYRTERGNRHEER